MENTDLIVNRDQLINHSMRIIGALESGETATNEELDDGAFSLNIMLKALQNDGLVLWLIKEAIMIPEKGLEQYKLGYTGSHCSYDMKKTEMRIAGIALDTIVEVDSTSNMLKDDNIGILQDDGTIHWTTIKTITDSDTIVISTGLVSAAEIANHIYFYTNKIDRPHEIKEVLRRLYDDRIDVPLMRMSRDEFYTLSDKDSEGVPVNFYYDPQLANSVMTVWNVADTNFAQNSVFVLNVKKPFDTMNDGTDVFEIPAEWYEPIAYLLAVRLAPMNFYPIAETRLLIAQAEEFKMLAQTPDEASIFLQPDFD